jgi:hypothetical protein
VRNSHFLSDIIDRNSSGTMNLHRVLQELYAQREKLERVIASLEELQLPAGATPGQPVTAKRRGRKSMGATERREVSARMKKYWALRRKSLDAEPT